MNESSADEPSRHERHSDLAGRDVPAEDSPVPAGPATLPHGARPWHEPDRLVLRPYVSFGCALLFMIVATGLAVAWIFLVAERPVVPLVLACVLVPWFLICAWFLYRQTILPRLTFDREAGLLMLGWKGLRGRRPLSSVIGVQVMQTRKQFGGPELNIPALNMYQLNLILDDPAERRLNVLTCDPLTARAKARLIADFLGVPVLDRGGPPPAATAPGAAEPMTADPTLAEPALVPSPVVTEPAPDVLLIRPRLLPTLSELRGMGLMGVVVLLALAAQHGLADWYWYIVAVVAAALCFPRLLLVTVGQRARFDRARGLLTLGWRGRRERPLASVKAVEIVNGLDYQLNLLPADASHLRLNLITDTDAALVRRAAERVATFLGVPLLGARRQAAAAHLGGVKAVDPLEDLNRLPLPPGRATIRGPACAVAKGEDVVMLLPRSRLSGRFLSSLIWIGLALYLVWLAAPAGFGQQAIWLTLVLLSGISQFALRRLLLYGWHFDRQAGLLTVGWVGLKETYPLEKVLAVQLIPGGLVDKAPGSLRRGGERVAYQLNLVMADAYQDRLNLTNDPDLAWTRQTGQQLADFLGVPLIDQIADDN